MGVNEEDQNANNIIISPNPSSDFINVNYQSKTLHPQFEIIDVLGRRVADCGNPSLRDKLQVTNSEQQQIDISKLLPGMYLLKVTDGDFHFAKRFVKN
jgi:hypothetical protein